METSGCDIKNKYQFVVARYNYKKATVDCGFSHFASREVVNTLFTFLLPFFN